MKGKRVLVFLFSILFVFSGCSKGNKENAAKSRKTPDTEVTQNKETNGGQEYDQNKFLIQETMESKAIAKNIVEEPAEREVFICLPPSYFDGDKRYPVVYYLHGQAESPSSFPLGNGDTLFQQFADGAKEFILVCIDGASNMGGAFYVNSPVSGNWEDYVVNEVVSYIDKHYRTIPKRDSRGICGFSMGGYGAYNLAFRHPDVYNSVLSMSPGALADGDFESAMQLWLGDSSFLTGYARAFSPKEKDSDEVYGNIPKMDKSAEDEKIIQDWEKGFGNLDQKLDAYVDLDNPLKAIKIIYGKMDAYDWIPRGCEALAKGMEKRNMKYELSTHDGGHNLPSDVIDGQIVPFFDSSLVFEE